MTAWLQSLGDSGVVSATGIVLLAVVVIVSHRRAWPAWGAALRRREEA